MITIEDFDLPITAAEKIIRGIRPNNPTELAKIFATLMTGKETAAYTVDMFSIEDIKEIADYLMVYYHAHETDD